jgi:hypothetical protein
MGEVDEYIKKVCEMWKYCPICGSEEGFDLKRIGKRIVCKTCSAEWLPEVTWSGEIKGLTLFKPDQDGLALYHKSETHPPEWWLDLRERLSKLATRRCPICGSEVGFGVKVDVEKSFISVKPGYITFCRVCSAEWKMEEKGWTLIKPDLDGRATKYLSQTMPPEEWVEMNLAGEKVTESKKELIPKIEGVEESKEELIAKLDKRLINGEISEETYKQILDRIKSMSEANKSKEREMEPKTEVE